MVFYLQQNFTQIVHYQKNANKEKTSNAANFNQRQSSSANVYYPPCSSPIVVETLHHHPHHQQQQQQQQHPPSSISDSNNFYLHSPASSNLSPTVSPSHVARNLNSYFEGNSPDQAENQSYSYNAGYNTFDVLMSTQAAQSQSSVDYFDYNNAGDLIIDEGSDSSNNDNDIFGDLNVPEFLEKTFSDVLLRNY